MAPKGSWLNTRGLHRGVHKDTRHRTQRKGRFPDLRPRITAAVAADPVDVLSRLWSEVSLWTSVGPSLSFTMNYATETWRESLIDFC
jgi:hypothetical protein